MILQKKGVPLSYVLEIGSIGILCYQYYRQYSLSWPFSWLSAWSWSSFLLMVLSTITVSSINVHKNTQWSWSWYSFFCFPYDCLILCLAAFFFSYGHCRSGPNSDFRQFDLVVSFYVHILWFNHDGLFLTYQYHCVEHIVYDHMIDCIYSQFVNDDDLINN